MDWTGFRVTHRLRSRPIRLKPRRRMYSIALPAAPVTLQATDLAKLLIPDVLIFKRSSLSIWFSSAGPCNSGSLIQVPYGSYNRDCTGCTASRRAEGAPLHQNMNLTRSSLQQIFVV